MSSEFSKRMELEVPRLRRYAMTLTRNQTAADDLVQECFARGLSKQHLWRADTDLRAWLFTIMHNLYINDIRRLTREGIIVPIGETTVTVSGSHDRNLILRDLSVALGELTLEQRTMINLVGFERQRYDDVAGHLGIPVGTLRSRLSRTRQILRARMNS
jgi:RNA polymerase sigma-70 factor (ECF subfamily)